MESIITTKEKGIDLVIQWIPSHIGIHGNEYIDSIAKQALLLPYITDISCPLADRENQCKTALWNSWRSERENAFNQSYLATTRDNDLRHFISYFTERKNKFSLTEAENWPYKAKKSLYKIKLGDNSS